MQQMSESDLEGHFDKKKKRVSGCAVEDCLLYSVLHHVTAKIPEAAVAHASISPALNCSQVQVPHFCCFRVSTYSPFLKILLNPEA